MVKYTHSGKAIKSAILERMIDPQKTNIDPEQYDGDFHAKPTRQQGKPRKDVPVPADVPAEIIATRLPEGPSPQARPAPEAMRSARNDVRAGVQHVLQPSDREPPEDDSGALDHTFHAGSYAERERSDALVQTLPPELNANITRLQAMLPQLMEFAEERKKAEDDAEKLGELERTISRVRQAVEDNILPIVRWAERSVSWDDRELSPALRRNILQELFFGKKPGKPRVKLSPEQQKMQDEIERLSAHPVAKGGTSQLRTAFEAALPEEMDGWLRHTTADLLMMLAPRRRTDVLKRIAQEATGEEAVAIVEMAKQGKEGVVYRVIAAAHSLVFKIFKNPNPEAKRLQEIAAKAGVAPPILNLEEERVLGMKHAPHSIEQEWIQLPQEKEQERQKHWRVRSRLLLHWLQKLHECGIVHLDLKPDNLCLQPLEACERAGMQFEPDYRADILRQGGMVPVLIDFGLAKNTANLAEIPKGQIRGTLNYLAPEILRGQPYGMETDTYALGCILFELATGKDWTILLLAAYGLGASATDIMQLPEKMEAKPEKRDAVLFLVGDPDQRKVIAGLLDPNPNTRLTVPRAVKMLQEMEDVTQVSVNASATGTTTEPESEWAETKLPEDGKK